MWTSFPPPSSLGKERSSAPPRWGFGAAGQAGRRGWEVCHHPWGLQRAAKTAPLLIDRLLWVPRSCSLCLHCSWPPDVGTCFSHLLHPPANTTPDMNLADPSPRRYQSAAWGSYMTKPWRKATVIDRWAAGENLSQDPGTGVTSPG